MHVGFVYSHRKSHSIHAPGDGLKHDHVLQSLWPHGEHCSFTPHVKLAHVNPTRNRIKNRKLKLGNYCKKTTKFLPPSHWLRTRANPTNAIITNFVNIFNNSINRQALLPYQLWTKCPNDYVSKNLLSFIYINTTTHRNDIPFFVEICKILVLHYYYKSLLWQIYEDE